MVRIGSFSLSVNGEYASTVTLPHGTRYAICLGNYALQPCTARIFIDGREVGYFRVGAHDEINIKRPVGKDREFTFFSSDTKQGEMAGLDAGNPELGSVRAVFTSAQAPPQAVCRGFGGQSAQGLTRGIGGVTRGVGGTGLGAQTNQRFVSCSELMDLDETTRTEIRLRIVLPAQEEDIVPLADFTRKPTRVTLEEALRKVNGASCLERACEVTDMSPQDVIITSKGCMIYVDRTWGYATVAVESIPCYGCTDVIGNKRPRGADECPRLTGQRIVSNKGVVYMQAIIGSNTLHYTMASLCFCGRKCDGTCTIYTMMVAEIIHPRRVCDITGMCPIVGRRFVHRTHDLDLCEEAFDALTLEQQAQFMVIPHPAHPIAIGNTTTTEQLR